MAFLLVCSIRFWFPNRHWSSFSTIPRRLSKIQQEPHLILSSSIDLFYAFSLDPTSILWHQLALNLESSAIVGDNVMTTFLFLISWSYHTYLIWSDTDALSFLIFWSYLPISYLDLIAQPPTCNYHVLNMHSPHLHCAASYMQLLCILHAVAMPYFTYIPSYLVVLSLASYCLLNPTASLESLARP